MKRRNFLAGAAALPSLLRVAPLSASEAGLPVCAQKASSPSATPMLDRYHLTRDRVLHGSGPSYTPDFLLEDIAGVGARRFTNFSGDVSGRWIEALSSASLTFGDKFDSLPEVVRRAIMLQHPDGYFGKQFHYDCPNDNDLALLWGNGRLLVGLVEYYNLSKDPTTLASAKKLGDFLLRIAPKYNSNAMAEEFNAEHFASSYICWTQQTEGLALLYSATQDVRYAKLCAEIGDHAEARPSDHVHGFLCSLRGTMMLYDLTHEARLLSQVEEKWSRINRSGDVLITGGVPEAWSPKKQRTEGCAECDWLRLNIALWQATGKTQYLEMAEKTLFNEFGMNQFASGDFGHAVLDHAGVPQQVGVRAWWCCTLHGMRAFADVHRSAFRVDRDQVEFAIPVDSVLRTPEMTIESLSTLAKDGNIVLHVGKATKRHLTIRKPAWASSIEVMVNGKSKDIAQIDIKTGDRIRVSYRMGLQPMHVAQKGTQAFAYGPWLLGLASAQNPGYFNELHAENTVIANTLKHDLAVLPQNKFSVSVASTTSEFLPAEFPEQPSTLRLSAISEQTGLPVTQWQIVFKTRSKA